MLKRESKKKLFQGIEHLQNTALPSAQYQNTSQQGTVERTSDEINVQKNMVIKKELLKTIVIFSILVLSLIVLMVYDQSSNGIEEFASKITKLYK